MEILKSESWWDWGSFDPLVTTACVMRQKTTSELEISFVSIA